MGFEINEDALWARIGKQGVEIDMLRQQAAMYERIIAEQRKRLAAQESPTAPATPAGPADGQRIIDGPNGERFVPMESCASPEDYAALMRRNGAPADGVPVRD